jgi:hypothetical protein
MDRNIRIYEFFSNLLSMFEKFGLPLGISAWIAVCAGAVGMGMVLKKSFKRDILIPSLIVGSLSLVSHILDYFITIRISPDLQSEGNPIWRIIIDHFGVDFAKVYGFTGKIFLSILSFEFFAYYLIQRETLFPKDSDTFTDFWCRFGNNCSKSLINWQSVLNLFSFCFAFIGIFNLYVAMLNYVSDSPIYFGLPAMPIALCLHLFGIFTAYFILTYRASLVKRKV